MVQTVIVVAHPLVQHKLTLMRRKQTSTGEFRLLLRELAPFLLYEATRDLPLTTCEIETPLTRMQAPEIAGKKLVFVPILRAGLGLLDPLLDLVPAARVGHIGLYRDPVTTEAVEYYCQVPKDIGERLTIVLDPMLATGHSAVAAITRLKVHGARNIRFVSVLSAPEGLATLREAHPDVQVFTAAIDSHLNDHAYIVPGLGDAGDRLFGTK